LPPEVGKQISRFGRKADSLVVANISAVNSEKQGKLIFNSLIFQEQI